MASKALNCPNCLINAVVPITHGQLLLRCVHCQRKYVQGLGGSLRATRATSLSPAPEGRPKKREDKSSYTVKEGEMEVSAMGEVIIEDYYLEREEEPSVKESQNKIGFRYPSNPRSRHYFS